MMMSFRLEVTSDGKSLFHGEGGEADRLEALIRFYAQNHNAETGIYIAEEWDAYRVEVDPAEGLNGETLICALDREFRESGGFRCIRRWVRGSTWGWLVNHLPGQQWVHQTRQ
jgi:hypothetical protein